MLISWSDRNHNLKLLHRRLLRWQTVSEELQKAKIEERKSSLHSCRLGDGLRNNMWSQSLWGWGQDGQQVQWPLSNLLSWFVVGKMSKTSLVNWIRCLPWFLSAPWWAAQLMKLAVEGVRLQRFVRYPSTGGVVASLRGTNKVSSRKGRH